MSAAVDLFREAIRLDPKLSIAHAYLATIQIQSIQFGWVKGTREMWAEAMAACRNQRPARPALLLCVLDPVLGARVGRP